MFRVKIEKDWRRMGDGACYWKELMVYMFLELKDET